ncbi:MAG TPA: DUF6505 family protein [Pelomicrobium sp.]|nr:DUF6505 family protein [Pelomicrobium sp.]
MRFLKAVRLDASDEHVFAADGAAEDGEWLVSGGYAVCPLECGEHRRPGCHCLDSFVAAGSLRRCTIGEVVPIDEAGYREVIEHMVRHFVADLGAPSEGDARRVAEEEAAYTADLCQGFAEGVWITVQREPNAEGIGEHYKVYPRLMIGAHKV